MALVPAFRCSHSGLYYPSDYIKEWGRKYGVGMGNVPVSECLDTQYHLPVDMSPPDSKRSHSVGVTRAQLDFCMVEESEYNDNRAILAIDDPDYSKRMSIIRPKQMQKSQSLKHIAV